MEFVLQVGGALVGVGEGEGSGEVVLGVAAGLEVFLEDEEVGQGGGEVVDGGDLYKGAAPPGPRGKHSVVRGA